ncbi:MAG: serine/threonine protein kinase [Myxococcaceae bacterium]|nr:serine/threonine protein kinase [Myxococcaceae bacterium]
MLMALAAGTAVGEYEVVQVLGGGAMGEVYEAVHPAIGKRVAIKVMRSPAAEALTEARRLLEEARVVNAIKHAGIVDIFGANVLPDGRPYLVMELLEGESLHEHLRANAPLDVDDVAWLLEGLLEPLAAAHKAGVTHRDLKPTNVFITKAADGTRRVKLLDFGVAHRVDRERFTSPEVTVGSLGFMGPEQLSGNAAPQSDLYAVGCVAWLLLVGQPVFPYRAMGELARHHMLTVPPPIRTLRADVPAPLERWVAKLLEKDLTRRPANAFEALLELRVAMEEAGEVTVLEDQGPTQALPSLRRATTDPETKQVVAVERSPAATLEEDDPESTIRVIPGRPRR